MGVEKYYNGRVSLFKKWMIISKFEMMLMENSSLCAELHTGGFFMKSLKTSYVVSIHFLVRLKKVTKMLKKMTYVLIIKRIYVIIILEKVTIFILFKFLTKQNSKR